MAQLELKNICKGFDHPVIDNLSLELEKGEFFVIVGPSGIGKTTLLRCIAGLEKLDQGEIGPNLFDQLQASVFNLMRADSYVKFKARFRCCWMNIV